MTRVVHTVEYFQQPRRNQRRGVDGATRRIRDGQRIRVRGTDGYIEILG